MQNEIKFENGTFVSYGNVGVCEVIACEMHAVPGDDEEEEKLYYKLRPANDPNSICYVPAETAAQRMRHLITRDEIARIFAAIREIERQNWCNDNRQRKESFQQIVHSDDYVAMFQMLRTLYQQKMYCYAHHRRLSTADESFLAQAETRICQEFSVVLDMSVEEVRAFLEKELQNDLQ